MYHMAFLSFQKKIDVLSFSDSMDFFSKPFRSELPAGSRFDEWIFNVQRQTTRKFQLRLCPVHKCQTNYSSESKDDVMHSIQGYSAVTDIFIFYFLVKN